MIKMQTNEQRAAGYRELQAEWRAQGKTVLAEKAAKRAAEFKAPFPQQGDGIGLTKPAPLPEPKRCGHCGMRVGSQQACVRPWVYDAVKDRCVHSVLAPVDANKG